MSDSKKEKVVYFVRHGQSLGNISPEFQRLDSPLSEEGLEQAEKIADRLTRITFDGLICSPLVRTKQTCAAITAKTHIEPLYSNLFVERIKPTGLEGKPHTDEEARAIWKDWNESLYVPGARVGDGENYDDQIVRADAALQFLEQRPEQALVVVTHGYFLKTLFARALLGGTLTPDNFRELQTHAETENTGISVLKCGDRFLGKAWYMWTYNDHAHLG
jgi:broad specificity phosphatase PhoE